MGMSVNSELRNFCVRWPAWAFIGWLSLADCFVCQLIWLEMNPDANGCWVAQNSFTTSYRKLMFDQKFISGGTKNRVMSMNVEQQGEGTRLMTCRLKDVNSSLHWILSSFLSETSYQSFLHGLPNRLLPRRPCFEGMSSAKNIARSYFNAYIDSSYHSSFLRLIHNYWLKDMRSNVERIWLPDSPKTNLSI